jgi:hypothetical protein
MALNTITVNFTECDPAPTNGYEIRYRPAGTAITYRDAGNFPSSPAVFNDDNDASGTQYEGHVRSDCGDGNFGQWVPWDTGTPGTDNINWTYTNTVGTGGRFKILVNGIIVVNETTSSSGALITNIGDVVEILVQSTVVGTAETDISGPYTNTTSAAHITGDEFTVAAGVYTILGQSL